MTATTVRRLAVSAAAGAVIYASHRLRDERAASFTGRVVLIMGGSRGLGVELAREFAGRGAQLALVARSTDEFACALRDLAERGARVFTHRADLTRRHDLQRAVEATLAHFGRIDVLVNNAGVIQVGPFAHMTAEDYEASLALHFWAPFHATEAVVPVMRQQGGGRIVNISSIGGKVSVPHLAPYCVGKFALTAYSDAARAELAADGILVTTVCPGLMRTGSQEKAWVKGRHDAEYAWFLVSDAIPGVSMASQRAARRIVDACATGRAELTLTPQARAAVMVQAVAPRVMAALQRVAARWMPAPAGPEGDEGRTGRQVQQGGGAPVARHRRRARRAPEPGTD